MKTIPILFAFDKRFEIPAGVCLTSLLENADADTFYDIFVLYGRGGDFSNSKLKQIPYLYPNCKITFRNVSDAFVGAYEIRGITEAAYYRLIAPELIPEYDKILYSDVDVIFREDISKYYELDLMDNYYGAVDNCSVLRPDVQEYVASLGLDYKDGYFYDGNLIINSKKLLEDKILDTFKELGKKKFEQQDMDIINIACNKRIMRLGLSYCISVQLYDLVVERYMDMCRIFSEEEVKHAMSSGIVHYNGKKPWKEACMNMDIWWDYYRRSIFFDEKFTHDFWHSQRDLLENLTLQKRIRILVRKLVGRD